jgi:hypothetical protein
MLEIEDPGFTGRLQKGMSLSPLLAYEGSYGQEKYRPGNYTGLDGHAHRRIGK